MDVDICFFPVLHCLGKDAGLIAASLFISRIFSRFAFNIKFSNKAKISNKAK